MHHPRRGDPCDRPNPGGEHEVRPYGSPKWIPLWGEHQVRPYSLDDVAAIYRWLKKRASFIASLCDAVETIIGLPALQVLFGWLNPRKHRWNFAILMALALGILVTLSQAIGEGIAPGGGRFVLLVMIFISGEALAVLLGYGLLARYLGVFRDQH